MTRPSPAAEAGSAYLRSRLEASVLLEALRPFAEAAEHLHPALPDDGVTLDGIEVRHWRAAYAAFHQANPESA